MPHTPMFLPEAAEIGSRVPNVRRPTCTSPSSIEQPGPKQLIEFEGIQVHPADVVIYFAPERFQKTPLKLPMFLVHEPPGDVAFAHRSEAEGA